MPNINLLPWREAQRKEQEKEFYVLLGLSAFLALTIWGLIHYYHVQKIDYQQSRNQLIQDTLTIVDKQIEEIKELEAKKTRLLAQIDAIQRLQGDRPLIVRLFDELVQNLPEGVSLESVTQKGQTIKLTGVAESNARISALMRNIEHSEWISAPKLNIVEGDEAGEQKFSAFTLDFSQTILGLSADDEPNEI